MHQLQQCNGDTQDPLTLTTLTRLGQVKLPRMLTKYEQVKLFGVNIDNNLNFKSHIKEICIKINQKASTLSRLQGYISEKKTKLLLNTVMMSNFQHCPLIWLFCSKATDNSINRTAKRPMRIIYNSDNEEALDALLQIDGTFTIHKIICKN